MLLNVKNTTFPGLLDLLAPHSCRGCGRLGNIVCDCCKNNLKCCNFNIQALLGTKNLPKNFPKIYALGPREGLLDDLTHVYKYDSNRSVANIFAKLLNEKLPKFKNAIIVPLPTSTIHIRSRGFDHMKYLAKHLAHLRKYQVSELLIRTKNTVQVGADEKTRKIQAESAFEVAKNAKFNNQSTYIVLDDVMTTGASIISAVKKLQRAGAKNIVVALIAISVKA